MEQMSAFTGYIMIWPIARIPAGWALCNGVSLNISDYTELYSVLGTTYGGDGVKTFGIPNLIGRAPIGVGQAKGLQNIYTVAQMGGFEGIELDESQMPAHTHLNTPVGYSTSLASYTGLAASASPATQSTPGGTNAVLAAGASDSEESDGPVAIYSYGPPTNIVQTPIPESYGGKIYTIATINDDGGNNAHMNIQPTKGANFIICTKGLYPNPPNNVL